MRNFPVRLPSLDLVRGFVAVGRRMSITLAAEDLFLTQSAVSRQIIALEEALGLRLLNRGYRSISFTAEGERFFRIADSAVQQLQDGVNSARVGARPPAGDHHRHYRRHRTVDHAAPRRFPAAPSRYRCARGCEQQSGGSENQERGYRHSLLRRRERAAGIAPLVRRNGRACRSSLARRDPARRRSRSRSRFSSNMTTRTAHGCNGPTGSIPWV